MWYLNQPLSLTFQPAMAGGECFGTTCDTNGMVKRKFLQFFATFFQTFTATAIYAFTTLAKAIRLSHRVFGRELVPEVAMSFAGVYARAKITAQKIFAVRDGFNMSRIDADRAATQMVGLKRLWHYLHKQLIDQVRDNKAMAAVVHSPVALVIQSTLPIPTGRSVMRMFGTDLNTGKDLCKNFCVDGESGNIRVKHSVFSYIENCLARLEGCFRTISSRFYFIKTDAHLHLSEA